MILRSIQTENFRNLPAGEYRPGEGVNVICGANGLGKTNLIESIWAFTGFRSFRSVRDKEMIKFGQDRAKLHAEYFADEWEHSADLIIDGNGRSFYADGKRLSSGSSLMKSYKCVVFTPVHLSIVKGAPEGRRNFLNVAISRLQPAYTEYFQKYRRALAQRNLTLRAAYEHNSPAAEILDIWEEEMAKYGSYIIYARIKFLNRINESAVRIYDELSSGREKLELQYREVMREPGEDRESIHNSLLTALRSKRPGDIERRVTSVGPHREEFSISLSGVNARVYASQGQQRSCALALKLAEAQVTADVTGEQPAVLLDDVFSELDPSRQRYVVSHFGGRQVFITCCDESSLKYIDGDAAVHRMGE